MAVNQNDLEAAALAYFGLKRERDIARAKALREQSGGSADSRAAAALLAIENTEMYRKFVEAEANYESLKLAQRSLADRASIGQSILRAQKAA